MLKRFDNNSYIYIFKWSDLSFEKKSQIKPLIVMDSYPYTDYGNIPASKIDQTWLIV